MKILLDECLPKRLAAELSGYEAVTAAAAGFAGIQNGELLRRIAGNYDAFVTIDGNLASQQNITQLSFGVVMLRAQSNKIEDIRPLIPKILAARRSEKPGTVIEISI